MDNIVISIIDPQTNEKTLLNLHEISFVEDGRNTNEEECVWIKMKNGKEHSFKVDYDTFVNNINSFLIQSGWNGICMENWIKN